MPYFRIGQVNNVGSGLCATGEIDTPDTNDVTIECGFKPNQIFICLKNGENYGTAGCAYDERINAEKQLRWVNATPTTVAIGYNNAYSIKDITDTGFTYRGYPNRHWYWFAVG